MGNTISGTFEKELIFESGAVAQVKISYRDVTPNDTISIITAIESLTSQLLNEIKPSK